MVFPFVIGMILTSYYYKIPFITYFLLLKGAFIQVLLAISYRIGNHSNEGQEIEQKRVKRYRSYNIKKAFKITSIPKKQHFLSCIF